MLPKEVDQVIPEHLSPNEIFSKHFKEIPESVQSGSYCSCSPCEIVTCFELRNQKYNLSCTCSMCRNPDTCADSSKNNCEKQSNSKKINDTNIQNEIEQIEKEICSEITKVSNAELDNREYTKFSCKDVLLKRNKIDWNIKNKSHDKSTTRQYNNSAAINYLPDERKNSTAKLSAQIMNMPYQDFKDSLSIENSRKKPSPIDIKSYPSIEKFRKNSFAPPKSSFDFKDILKTDFLTRLKEVYDACSCKVCECITGTSLPISSNECNCKPCDCNECTNNMKTLKNYVKQIPHDGCPCVSCDRKDCRGVVKKKDEISCSCVPCDCVKCAEDFTTSCDCEPCQCIECKALGTSLLRTFIVAPLHENIQHNVCQCEPCECMNCTHNYSSMASSLRRQVSTEIISNRNCHCDGCLNNTCQLNSEDCRCDMQSKIMKKPIERASRDYDIHSTLISCQKGKSKFNNDTIITFALCNNNYCKTISYSHSKVNDCYCSNCECLVCKEKEEYKEDSRRIHSEILNKYSKPFLDSKYQTCKCSPCECQICSKCNKQANKLTEKCFKTSCECNKCHCFICKGMLNTNNESCSQNKITGSLFSDTNTISCEKPYFSRKGKILIPSTFEANKDVASQQQSSTHMSDHSLKRKPKKISYFNVPANKSIINKKVSRHQTVTACHTESKQNNIDEVYDKVIKCENSKFSANNILFNEYFPNEDLNMVDEVYVFKKSTSLSENRSNNKLCEIFNANKQNPISDIGLLDTIIHLTKSLSKTDILLNKFVLNSENVKHKYSDESDEKCLFDRKVACINITPKESVHTIILSTMDIEDNDFDEKRNFERFHTVSSRTFILCDKKSSSMAYNRNHLQNTDRINSKNNFESDFKNASDIIHTDSMSYNVKPFTNDLNDIVDLKSHESNNDLKVKDMGTTVAKSKTKLVKCNTYKSTIKCIGKKYNKMYTKLNKMKQNKDKIKVDEKDIKVLEPTENVLSAFVGKDICSINDNNIESLEYSVNKRKDSDLQTTSSLTMTPYDKLFNSKNVLHNIMETQTQNIDLGDNTETWSIMRKNLYLNGYFDTKMKDVCTIPTMDFDNNIFLKSISMQTSEFDNKIEKSSGKHSLNKLLIEVNDLLNSPLLQSSHSNKKTDELKEELSHLSKKKMDSELKNDCSDATSQTRANCSPVDKETYCNLIQSKGFHQRNTKLVKDNVLTKAAFDAEHLRTERNLVQGYTQNMPTINSCKSSCHGLRATFVSLRTISDHTLMVKWRLPREVAHVQGYELQVDGRPVQKIFSPTRCMAILTCLPHSEKLLLTIRTLTTSSLPSDHQPATTIVYRPRVKCSLYSH